jgi:type IV pilus assembly protein PilO
VVGKKAFGDYSRSSQAAVLLGLAAVFGVGAFWLLVLPLSRQSVSLGEQVNQLRIANQAGRAQEGQRALLQLRVAEAETRLEEIKSKVPDEPQADEIVTLMRETESAAGVHVRSFISQSPVQASEYVQLPYNLHVDGTYFALLSFFDHLAGATRIVDVSALSLVVPSASGRGAFKTDPSETVAADFVLSAYYNHSPAAKPGAKQP